MPDIIYKLNDRDEICFVNEAYDEFAVANAGITCASAAVLNYPLWNFITDITTQLLYRDLLQRARAGRRIQFNFRCDSPTCRRLLEMNLSCGEDGMVEFRVRTISEESRPPQALLEPHAARSDQLLRMCAWCKKICLEDVWVDVEEAAARLRLFEQSMLPLLTHGICELCRQAMRETVAPT
jgi:hypothetical protein